jgi:hypothetical protein
VVLVPQGDSYRAQLRFAFGALIPGAQPVLTPVIPIDLNLSSQDRDKALAQGIVFSRTVKLSDEASAVRLVVVDRSSRAIGSVTVPVPEQTPHRPR